VSHYTGLFNLFAENTFPAALESNTVPLYNEFVTGYVLTFINNTAILITPDPQPYNIPKSILQKYFLSSSDKVTAEVTKSINQYAVTSIIKVNRQTRIPDGFTKHFDDRESVHSVATMTVNGKNINMGNTAMVVLGQGENVTEKTKDAISLCDKDTIVIALGVDRRQEDLNYLMQNGCHYGYLATQKQPLKQQLMIALIAFFRAKELAESGKTILLSISDLEKLLVLFNEAITMGDEFDDTKITHNAIRDFGNLIRSSKTLANGGSLTILGFFIENNTEHSKSFFNILSGFCDYII
jgi:transcription termination factor Rho